MKSCFKCNELKPLFDFYAHPMMADGRVNKCKECNKRDVRQNRASKINYYRAYDTARGARHEPGRTRQYRDENPGKHAAHVIVAKAIKRGHLHRQNCEVCSRSDNTHAHHDDYAKPLNVRWLCPPCHVAWHSENGEAPNGGKICCQGE